MLSVLTVTTTAATKTSKHKIKKGDTLYAIALKNHTTVTSIRKANGLKKGQALKMGKVLTVPTKSTSSKKKKRTKVASSSKQKKQLARTLNSVKFKQANRKKSSKYSINDIIFKGKNNKQSMKMIQLAKKKLGRRYVWGAVGQKNTFDCSGLTKYVCKKNGITIPRRAIQQSKCGKYVSRKNLKPGDLIFFDTSKRRKGYVNHVGIYIGNNKFIHASSAKKKVIITSLNKNFYSNRYKGARRVTS
jgi:cell wall-associated NlpC family hydrolase